MKLDMFDIEKARAISDFTSGKQTKTLESKIDDAIREAASKGERSVLFVPMYEFPTCQGLHNVINSYYYKGYKVECAGVDPFRQKRGNIKKRDHLIPHINEGLVPEDFKILSFTLKW